MAAVSMPKTSVDKEDEGAIGKDKIRTSGKVRNMRFISEAPAIEESFHFLLRSRVPTLDPSHTGQPLFASHDVAH
jgi:hypothetical protein